MRRTSGWGSAGLVMALAACSHRSPAEPPAGGPSTGAPAPTAVPVPDATLLVAPDATATAPVAAGACLPRDVSTATSIDAGEARLCWSAAGGDDDAADTCLWMSVDGKVRRGPAPAASSAPAFPRVTVLDGDRKPLTEESGPGSSVEVCLREGACRTIVPRGGADAIADFALDAAGAQLAILLQADPLDGGKVEVHDARTGKRVASGRMVWDDHHGVGYHISWIGRWLLWVEHPGATNGANGTLHEVSGSKLAPVSGIADRVYDHAVGARFAVFVGSALSAEVHRLATGKPARTIDLADLHDAGPDASWEETQGLGPSVATDGDAALFWLEVDSRLRLAFGSLTGGAATFVEVPRCPAVP
jgi:hypothetical protein